MISFKSRYLSSSTILQKNSENQYTSKRVSFVEINPLSKSDNQTLASLDQQWENGRSYVNDIIDSIETGSTCCDEEIRRFALTTQESKFGRLSPKKVLGVIEISDYSNELFINYLQSNPAQKYNAKNREFKGIGQTLIEKIEELIPKKKIRLFADKDAIPFYKKLGFKKTHPFKDSIMYLIR